MNYRGNRPDCAYFLLVATALAAFLLTMGGVFTYVSYWPESEVSGSYHHKKFTAHQRHNIEVKGTVVHVHSNNNHTTLSSAEISSGYNQTQEHQPNDKEHNHNNNLPMKILGPTSLLIGLFILLTVIVYAFKYKCDHEPEPNISFLRLKSELSLNFDSERNKYELMTPPRPSGYRNKPSTSMSNEMKQKY